MAGFLVGQPIARGRTAEIYPWKAGKIIKLFYEGWSGSNALCEVRGARIARAGGVRVPVVGDLMQIEGRTGVVFSFLPGQTLLRTLSARPWSVVELACLFADLHAAIHRCVAPELPAQRVILEREIRLAPLLTARQKSTVLNMLENLPDGDRLCHGDFHPDNVLLGKRGPVVVDWADASRGNPWGDVAQTMLRLLVSPSPSGVPRSWLIELGRPWFRWLYRRRYTQLRPDDCWQLADWVPVVAAARLSSGPSEEQGALLAIVRRGCSRTREGRPTRRTG